MKKTIKNPKSKNNETNESIDLSGLYDALYNMNSTNTAYYQNLLNAVTSVNTTTAFYGEYILNDTSLLLTRTSYILSDTNAIRHDVTLIKNDTTTMLSILRQMNNTINLIYDQGSTILENTHLLIGNMSLVLDAIAAEAINDSNVNDALYQINNTVNNILTTSLQINDTVTNIQLNATNINQSQLVEDLNNSITGQITCTDSSTTHLYCRGGLAAHLHRPTTQSYLGIKRRMVAARGLLCSHVWTLPYPDILVARVHLHRHRCRHHRSRISSLEISS